MIKDTMEWDMINEISALFVMIFMSGLMFVMPMLDIECDDTRSIGYCYHNRIRDNTIFYINHNTDHTFL